MSSLGHPLTVYFRSKYIWEADVNMLVQVQGKDQEVVLLILGQTWYKMKISLKLKMLHLQGC